MRLPASRDRSPAPSHDADASGDSTPGVRSTASVPALEVTVPAHNGSDLAQATLDAIADAVISIDASGIVTYLNPAAQAITGWSTVTALGQPVDAVLQLLDPVTRRPVPNPLQQAIARDTTVGLPPQCLLVSRDGRETPVEDSTAPIHDAARAVSGAVIVFRPVGATLARAIVLEHTALHDPLTGLPNRQLLLDRLAAALALPDRRHRSLAVGFIDVDGFKQVNDTWGHQTGDWLLQAIGARLQAAVRHSDTVARFGGDEFVVVLTEVAAHEQASAVTKALLSAATGPHWIDGREMSVSISVGMALYPQDGRDGSALIAHADRTMYAAKTHGTRRAARPLPGAAEPTRAHLETWPPETVQKGTASSAWSSTPR
ncbi:MAG: diguanylate cyclase [Acidobacteria bacterium]|nr:diguanylate cyclase [Acidobacteriota bacterium]